MHVTAPICRLSLELHLGREENDREGVSTAGTVLGGSHLFWRFSGVHTGWRRLSLERWEDCFQNNLGECVILSGQILYDVKVIHVRQFLQRGLQSYSVQRLIELPGLPVEFWRVVLTHNHHHRTGWTHGRRWSHLQAALWAVSLSVFQGHVQRGILGGINEGLQVIDPTHQEKACEGEEVRPGTRPSRMDPPTLQVSTLAWTSLSSSCSTLHPPERGRAAWPGPRPTETLRIGHQPGLPEVLFRQAIRNLGGWA